LDVIYIVDEDMTVSAILEELAHSRSGNTEILASIKG
jgi:hypothetical protein